MNIPIFREALVNRQELLTNELLFAEEAGHVVIDKYFTDEAIEAVQAEAEAVPHIWRRKIKEWHNVDRATFSLGPPRMSIERAFENFQKQEKVVSRLRRICLQAAHAELWVPTTAALAKGLQADHRAAARSIGGMGSVADIRFNRVGFNYMCGWAEDPAVIPEHTDVMEERGLVAAINLTVGMAEGSPGAMHLLLGHDTCEKQAPHAVSADRYRVGLTLAELDAPGRVS